MTPLEQYKKEAREWIGALLLFVLIFSAISISEWYNKRHLAKESYQGARVHINMAAQYAADERYDLSEWEWLTALEYPEGNGVYHYNARLNLYYLYMRRKRNEEAIEQVKGMLRIRDRHPEIKEEL